MNQKNKKRYQVFVAPSSDDEDIYSECDSFEKALEIMGLLPDPGSAQVFYFDTMEEVNAFIEGYTSALGYLGDLPPLVGENVK